jgi:hypothetical protein
MCRRKREESDKRLPSEGRCIGGARQQLVAMTSYGAILYAPETKW